MTSPSTSPGQTGASPGSVSAALGNGHADGAEIVQSLVRTQGGFTIDGDGIGDACNLVAAIAEPAADIIVPTGTTLRFRTRAAAGEGGDDAAGRRDPRRNGMMDGRGRRRALSERVPGVVNE